MYAIIFYIKKGHLLLYLMNSHYLKLYGGSKIRASFAQSKYSLLVLILARHRWITVFPQSEHSFFYLLDDNIGHTHSTCGKTGDSWMPSVPKKTNNNLKMPLLVRNLGRAFVLSNMQHKWLYWNWPRRPHLLDLYNYDVTKCNDELLVLGV